VSPAHTSRFRSVSQRQPRRFILGRFYYWYSLLSLALSFAGCVCNCYTGHPPQQSHQNMCFCKVSYCLVGHSRKSYNKSSLTLGARRHYIYTYKRRTWRPRAALLRRMASVVWKGYPCTWILSNQACGSPVSIFRRVLDLALVCIGAMVRNCKSDSDDGSAVKVTELWFIVKLRINLRHQLPFFYRSCRRSELRPPCDMLTERIGVNSLMTFARRYVTKKQIAVFLEP
jgi:hypothetical protein